MKNEIKFTLTEDGFIRLLAVLSEANEVELVVAINQAWLDGPGRKQVQVEAKEKLQDLRGFLFRLKGFLEAEAAGYPRQDLNWVRETIEIVKTLQLEV